MTTQPLTKPELLLSTRTLLIGIWGHLSRRRRIQLGLLLMAMLASGVAELLSLGSVMPFLAVLSESERLWQQPGVQPFATLLGITTADGLLFPATYAFIIAAVIAAGIRLLNLWLNGRLAASVGSDLSCEAYRRTLYQPYSVHVQRNSAVVITGTISQISITVSVLNSLLQLITSTIVAVALLIGLLIIDASVALSASVLISTAYGALAFTTRRELRRNGQNIAETSTQQLKALQEGLGAIRDVLLDGNQQYYLQIYRQADRPQRQLRAKNVFLGTFPRYALEAIGMSAIAVLGLLLVLQKGSEVAVIPLLGAMALGAQRLLPALQQIYSGWASLKGCNAAMYGVLAMLDQPLPPHVSGVIPLKLRQNICLKSVSFCYGSDQPNILRGLDLKIYRGECIGLIGATGSGKSTTIDLLMGLLAPTEGQIFVDGQDLHDFSNPERLAAWRAAIAHVPQSIYLADSSIAENIAFGVPSDQIDLRLVRQAAARAQIASFIEASSDGYQSFVGERGVRLSGGQRQRIGIARALYKKAKLLVFDEATSALDHQTESVLMSTLQALSLDMTVIMVAHRLSTVKKCNRVFEVKDGKAFERDIRFLE